MYDYKKVFKFGKVDFTGTGRRNNAVEVELNLNGGPHGPAFSVVGNIWNGNRSDVVARGQILNDLDKFEEIRGNETFRIIIELWRRHHLNDMRIGSPEQLAALDQLERPHSTLTYREDCDYLRSINLYEVTVDGKPCPYGAHVYREIPADDLALIHRLLGVERPVTI